MISQVVVQLNATAATSAIAFTKTFALLLGNPQVNRLQLPLGAPIAGGMSTITMCAPTSHRLRHQASPSTTPCRLVAQKTPMIARPAR